MENEKKVCGKRTEIYSRVVGYFRPVSNWNNGKREEFKDRLEYSVEKSLGRKNTISPIIIKAKTAVKEPVLVA